MRLAIKVTARASRNEIAGWTTAGSQRELAVRVCAPPAGGEANKAVTKTVAASLGIARSRVSIVRGQTSHHKQLDIDVDADAFRSWCENLPEIA